MEGFKEEGRGEKAGDLRLTDKDVESLIKTYGALGLEEDPEHREYFRIVRKDGSEIRFHKFKKINEVQVGEQLQDMPIREYIEKRLDEVESEKTTEEE